MSSSHEAHMWRCYEEGGLPAVQLILLFVCLNYHHSWTASFSSTQIPHLNLKPPPPTAQAGMESRTDPFIPRLRAKLKSNISRSKEADGKLTAGVRTSEV